MTLFVDGKPIDYEARDLIPEYMRGAMERYMEHGIEPGSFLMAVLSNDLLDASSLADDFNRHRLFDYCVWLIDFAPVSSYGSPEIVKRWMAARQMESGLDQPS